ncbi:MAG: CocE/NonD family hydrolase [Arenicellales bacterium]
MTSSLNTPFTEIDNASIPLSDGRQLAARVWLPRESSNASVPAILEYLPYRKRDGTAQRDDSTYPVFAAAGYAGVRVDISGTGESDGDFDDEYSPRELADCLEIIDWIAIQPWCDGNIGMMGISWGGFNSLQLAALQPPALKAVIAIGTTVDRYNDDIHYKNGSHLYSNFYWSSTMLCFASRPPDPQLVGDRWREMWKHRLDTQPFPLETWLEHQRRDDYWKHGSVCEDYAAIQIPCLVISGWGDGYINAPPSMAQHSGGLTKAVNGPWIHKYPHIAWPRPRMDYHREAISWWNRWLKNIENDVEQIPAYRAYISEGVVPGGFRQHEPGFWVGESTWPSDQVHPQSFYPSARHTLKMTPGNSLKFLVCSPQDCGTACGEFFALKPDSELSGDQRLDDAGSLIFETDVLQDPYTILGRPSIQLNLSVDRPVANIAVRLLDIGPEGVSHRVSWGVLNLTHRDSHENPKPMTPGKTETIKFQLDECGYRFLPGHKIRLAISTAYWPMVMPPPERVTATIMSGEHTCVTLPLYRGDNRIEIPEPENKSPLPEYKCHLKPDHQRVVETDIQHNRTHYRVFDDTGEYEIPDHGMRIRHTHEECWSIAPDDPLTSTASSIYTCYLARDNWRIRTVAESSLTCDKDNFYLEASVTAWDADQVFSKRQWDKVIKRDHL